MPRGHRVLHSSRRRPPLRKTRPETPHRRRTQSSAPRHGSSGGTFPSSTLPTTAGSNSPHSHLRPLRSHVCGMSRPCAGSKVGPPTQLCVSHICLCLPAAVPWRPPACPTLTPASWRARMCSRWQSLRSTGGHLAHVQREYSSVEAYEHLLRAPPGAAAALRATSGSLRADGCEVRAAGPVVQELGLSELLPLRDPDLEWVSHARSGGERVSPYTRACHTGMRARSLARRGSLTGDR